MQTGRRIFKFIGWLVALLALLLVLGRIGLEALEGEGLAELL